MLLILVTNLFGSYCVVFDSGALAVLNDVHNACRTLFDGTSMTISTDVSLRVDPYRIGADLLLTALQIGLTEAGLAREK